MSAAGISHQKIIFWGCGISFLNRRAVPILFSSKKGCLFTSDRTNCRLYRLWQPRLTGSWHSLVTPVVCDTLHFFIDLIYHLK